jgi:hypothetical protein
VNDIGEPPTTLLSNIRLGQDCVGVAKPKLQFQKVLECKYSHHSDGLLWHTQILNKEKRWIMPKDKLQL